jgi:hypothetical protein
MALGHIALPVSTYRHPATSGPKLILDVGNTVFEPGKEDRGSGSGSGDKEEKKTEGQEKKGSEESKS